MQQVPAPCRPPQGPEVPGANADRSLNTGTSVSGPLGAPTPPASGHRWAGWGWAAGLTCRLHGPSRPPQGGGLW